MKAIKFLSQGRRTFILVILLITGSSLTVFAQRPSSEELQKIQDAKVAIITNRLNLTSEQSVDFWPLYNEYASKRRELHRSQRKLMNDKKTDNKTDEQVLNSLNEVQDMRQQELNLEKEYQSKFLKVISANQVAELYKAERTFNDMLIQRLKQQRPDKKLHQ
jgi:Spy/CpxP family protein refolding chaperone